MIKVSLYFYPSIWLFIRRKYLDINIPVSDRVGYAVLFLEQPSAATYKTKEEF